MKGGSVVGTMMMIAACTRQTPPSPPRLTGPSLVTRASDAGAATKPDDPARTLCAGRARCEVQRTRAARDGLRVFDLLIRLPVDAGSDQCAPREYWRVGDGQPRLLAVDCNEQRSAEEAAAAKTEVVDGRLVVDYVEFQASDHCERYQASLDIRTLAIISQTRREGPTDARGCHAATPMKKMARRGTAHPAGRSFGCTQPGLTFTRSEVSVPKAKDKGKPAPVQPQVARK